MRLEWADIEAFDGKAEPALRPEDLASAAGPRLKLTIQPYVRLLSFRVSCVDDLLLEVRKEEGEDTDFASNTFAEHTENVSAVRAVCRNRGNRRRFFWQCTASTTPCTFAVSAWKSFPF